MKRAFDIFFSLLGLILLIPVFVIVGILIKLGTPGPVFFVQRRIGRDLMPFSLYKFRTMVADAPQRGPSLTAGDDPRITKIGRFLRKTKVDELPQLFNVLKGDMSLVGPRPEMEKYVTHYSEDYKEILKLRPGMTDMAFLKYSNEEEILRSKKDPEDYYLHVLLPEKIKLAREYTRRASLANDLKLIFLTAYRLLYPYESARRLIEILTPYRRLLVTAIQFIAFVLANYFAFSIRFDGQIPVHYFRMFLKYLPLLLLVRVVFLFLFSLDKGLWRYVSIRDLATIMSATTIGSVVFLVVVRNFLGVIAYPRSIYIIDWFLNIFLLGGVRLFRRLHERARSKGAAKKRIIVIGAGDAAEMLLRDIGHSSFYPYEVIGFIDDNPRKKGLRISNVSIMGTRKDLKGIIESEHPDEFLVAIPTATREEFEGIVKDLRQYGLPIKAVPSFWSILSGKQELTSLKTIEPEDILFRAPAPDNMGNLRGFFEGKKVLITGAGGSIGSEISRQVASFNPKNLILFERHEESLYKIDLELRSHGQSPSVPVSLIGDILDERRFDEIMSGYRPEIVMHAAAYKHVPLMEDNPREAFKANVLGTWMAAEKAMKYGAEHFVLISTDKAVNPVNVMGMTKKIAEDVIRYCSNHNKPRETSASDSGPAGRVPFTRFITVRFGNVLESSGSVVPLFSEQIRKGGPVTVTHPEVIRYFMTIPEAVSLVLQSVVMGEDGEVFVLDMGNPVKILDLAKRMISLNGHTLGVDMDISFIGLRPGEKLYEELFNGDELIEKTPHPKINKAISKRSVNVKLVELLTRSIVLGDNNDVRNAIVELLE